MSKQAIFTVGISGSGKSTWAWSHQDAWRVIDRDVIRRTHLILNVKEYDPAEDNMWEHWDFQTMENTCNRRREELIEAALYEGSNIIFADTNLNYNKLQPLMQRLIRADYSVEFKFFPTTLEDAKYRNVNRRDAVPEHLLQIQYTAYNAFRGAPIRLDYNGVPFDVILDCMTGDIDEVSVNGVYIGHVLAENVVQDLRDDIRELALMDVRP
jgi:predicted kinase